ncbi:MAG: hypothetical protein AABP62_13595 [Planctomycetota bacterium]
MMKQHRLITVAGQSRQRMSGLRCVAVACAGLLWVAGPAAQSVHAAPGANNVTAIYSAGTLLLTGDSFNNNITLTVQAGFLQITGVGGTTVNGLTVYSVAHAGPLAMTADLRGGNDTLTITQATVNISTLQMGTGDDTLLITNRSTVAITLFDGGAGRETIRLINSSVRIKTFRNFP